MGARGLILRNRFIHQLYPLPTARGRSYLRTQLRSRGKLLFIVDDGAGHALCKTSGSAKSTKRLRPLNEPDGSTVFNRLAVTDRDELYFGASDSDGNVELWNSDGTPDGTRRPRFRTRPTRPAGRIRQ